MQPHHVAALRSVATGCQTAVKAVLAGMHSGTLVDLEDALAAGQGALRRADAQRSFLSRQLPSHSRIVRVASKAVDKAREALYEADPSDGKWPDGPAVDKAAQAALRASQAILVDLDGASAWLPPERKQVG